MSNLNSTLKPIDTRYRGFLFRSRLEARWAVFMDALNIQWLYEHEGYDLDGLWYLPDFWLPTFNGGSFLEVKPNELNTEELEKAKRLATKSGCCVILAVGLPDTKCLEYFYTETCNGITNVDIAVGLMNADQAWDENRMFTYPGYESADLTIPSHYYDCLRPSYINAVMMAKGARF